jgi:hypothetical protein
MTTPAVCSAPGLPTDGVSTTPETGAPDYRASWPRGFVQSTERVFKGGGPCPRLLARLYWSSWRTIPDVGSTVPLLDTRGFGPLRPVQEYAQLEASRLGAREREISRREYESRLATFTASVRGAIQGAGEGPRDLHGAGLDVPICSRPPRALSSSQAISTTTARW